MKLNIVASLETTLKCFTLALFFPDMGDRDKVYHFITNLSHWAKERAKAPLRATK